MRASQFINEAVNGDAVNELDSYIMNNEDLYRRRFMPIISNLKRNESSLERPSENTFIKFDNSLTFSKNLKNLNNYNKFTLINIYFKCSVFGNPYNSTKAWR